MTVHSPSWDSGSAEVYEVASPERKNSSWTYPTVDRSNLGGPTTAMPAPVVIGPSIVGVATSSAFGGPDKVNASLFVSLSVVLSSSFSLSAAAPEVLDELSEEPPDEHAPSINVATRPVPAARESARVVRRMWFLRWPTVRFMELPRVCTAVR